MSLKKLTSSFWAILGIFILCLSNTSCTDTETTDSTNFVIYYTGMTDIGPSMTGIISSPSYKGATPSDFAITGITINGEEYTGQCFNINSETGEITVSNTKNAAVGTYKISISCMSNGNRYEYKDIITVNMLKAVPEGVKVEPNKLEIKLAYIINNEEQIELPTAQVTTDGSHVSISQYAISSVLKDGVLFADFAKLFQISQTGVISAIEGYENAEPGIYTLNLKLRTNAMDKESEDGIFENAVTIDITSEPLKLIYTPSEEFIEEATSEQPNTKYDTKTAPVMMGSKDGMAFSIESVTPETDQSGNPTINRFTIDGEGKIHVAAQHGFKIGEIFYVSVRVKNKYAPEGVLFSNVLKLETVNFIHPIENFEYGTAGVVNQVEKSKFTIKKNDAFKGDKVSFSWLTEGLDKTVIEQLQPGFNPETGEFSINKGNKLPIGEYLIRVEAKNQKSDDNNPTIAEFTLKIGLNPNNFTTFSYGNNYSKYYTGDFSDAKYDNQFRYRAAADITKIKPIAESFDFNPEVKPGYTPTVSYKIVKTRKVSIGGINTSTGEFKFNWPTGSGDMSFADAAMVTATAYDGTTYSDADDDPTAVSISLPVFVHISMLGGTVSKPTDDYRIEYIPFVLKASPRNGGELQGKLNIFETINEQTNPIKWSLDNQHFAIDYARTFYYYNIGGIRNEIDNDYEGGEEIPNGTAHETGADGNNQFITNLWLKNDANTGAKDPVSGFIKDGGEPKTDFSKTLAYIDNSNGGNFIVKVLPNMWFEHGYANGLFIAQMTYTAKPNGNITTTDKKNIKGNGIKTFPFVIWLDEKFGE